ncbi:MAG: STAS domain-containing protein, partial [Chloroflexaceae bacterium]
TSERSPAARFSVFLSWCIALAVILTLIDMIVGLLLSQTLFLVMASINLGAAILLWGIRAVVRRGQTVLATGLFLALVFSASLAIAVLVPMIAIPLIFIVTACGMVVLPLIPRRRLLVLFAGLILLSLGLALIERFVSGSQTMSAVTDSMLFLVSMATGIVLLFLAVWQYHQQITAALRQLEELNHALVAARGGLEIQVTERTAALQQALADVEARAIEETRLRQEIEQQREVIRDLSMPVLPVSRDTLVMPLIGALDSSRLAQLRERALGAIERTGARQMVLDVTGVPAVDTQVARGLLDVVHATRLLGATTTLVGITPDVARTIVSLGLDLSEVRTRADLQAALGSL